MNRIQTPNLDRLAPSGEEQHIATMGTIAMGARPHKAQ
jgi:hypothetical protein